MSRVEIACEIESKNRDKRTERTDRDRDKVSAVARVKWWSSMKPLEKERKKRNKKVKGTSIRGCVAVCGLAETEKIQFRSFRYPLPPAIGEWQWVAIGTIHRSVVIVTVVVQWGGDGYARVHEHGGRGGRRSVRSLVVVEVVVAKGVRRWLPHRDRLRGWRVTKEEEDEEE